MKIEVKIVKSYNKPEVEIMLLSENDVISTSPFEETPKGRYLKTFVAGNEGKNYGQQNVSIYE